MKLIKENIGINVEKSKNEIDRLKIKKAKKNKTVKQNNQKRCVRKRWSIVERTEYKRRDIWESIFESRYRPEIDVHNDPRLD